MDIDKILRKIRKIEKVISENKEIDDIIYISFYTDRSGHIHSSEYEYFEFSEIDELEDFLIMRIKYILSKRKKFPL